MLEATAEVVFEKHGKHRMNLCEEGVDHLLSLGTWWERNLVNTRDSPDDARASNGRKVWVRLGW